MGHFFCSIARWLGLRSPAHYPYPAIDIQLTNHRYLHLVGSIHMGTQNMSPLPAILSRRLEQADALIVEADISNSESPFSEPEGISPLVERITEQQYQQIKHLCSELGTDIERLSHLPYWQIALILQAGQAQRLGLRGEFGIDYQLLQEAKQRHIKVIELEGTQQQLELLQQLPENGHGLLEDTVTHWHTNARLLQTMIGWWLNYQPNKSSAVLPSTFSSDLFDILMYKRNKRWKQLIEDLPAGNYVIAVGALHLYGEGNLPQLLADKKKK